MFVLFIQMLQKVVILKEVFLGLLVIMEGEVEVLMVILLQELDMLMDLESLMKCQKVVLKQ